MSLLETIRSLDQRIFKGWSNRYVDLLEKELVGSCESVLDVACGSDSPIQAFSKKIPRTVGIDGFAPSLERSHAQGIHSEYRQVDIQDLPKHFEPRSFDAVIALDVIEHFEKSESEAFLDSLEQIAKKKVVVFTPNGFLPQDPYDGNDFQKHKCGWKPEEFEARGYKVIGINGWKPLRMEFANVRWKPEAVWNRVSALTQPLVQNHPTLAFQILAIKNCD